MGSTSGLAQASFEFCPEMGMAHGETEMRTGLTHGENGRGHDCGRRLDPRARSKGVLVCFSQLQSL